MNEIYEYGLCVEADVADLFFSEDVGELAQAQAICGECPVRLDCLSQALAANEEWGVWGGVIFWDGVAFYRKRGRGRPRKEEAALPLEADRAELWQLVASA